MSDFIAKVKAERKIEILHKENRTIMRYRYGLCIHCFENIMDEQFPPNPKELLMT